MTQTKIHPGARIGHVHLKVADLERGIAFYRDVLGFEVTKKIKGGMAFLSAGGYHHHIGLNTWESRNGEPPERGRTGLNHLAIVYPDRAALAEAYARVVASGVRIEGAAYHGVSEAIYLRDPDDNGVEIYCDRPENEWPRESDGTLSLASRRLDLSSLLAEREAA